MARTIDMTPKPHAFIDMTRLFREQVMDMMQGTAQKERMSHFLNSIVEVSIYIGSKRDAELAEYLKDVFDPGTQ